MKRIYHDIIIRDDISFSSQETLEILSSDFSRYGEEVEKLISEFYEKLHELSWSIESPELGLFISQLCISLHNAGINSLGQKIVIENNKSKKLTEYTKFRFDLICNLPKSTLDSLNTELSSKFLFTNQ